MSIKHLRKRLRIANGTSIYDCLTHLSFQSKPQGKAAASEVDMPMNTTYVKHFSVQDGIELFDNKVFVLYRRMDYAHVECTG